MNIKKNSCYDDLLLRFLCLSLTNIYPLMDSCVLKIYMTSIYLLAYERVRFQKCPLGGDKDQYLISFVIKPVADQE